MLFKILTPDHKSKAFARVWIHSLKNLIKLKMYIKHIILTYRENLILNTRMHSSRMRVPAARRPYAAVCFPGGSAWSRGVYAWSRGVCLVRGVSAWSGGGLPGAGRGVCLVLGGGLHGLGDLPGPGGVWYPSMH